MTRVVGNTASTMASGRLQPVTGQRVAGCHRVVRPYADSCRCERHQPATVLRLPGAVLRGTRVQIHPDESVIGTVNQFEIWRSWQWPEHTCIPDLQSTGRQYVIRAKIAYRAV